MAEQTRFLDRGDGVCRHYDETNRLCAIYETRPDICRVDRMHDKVYASQYTWREFVIVNVQVCEALKAADARLSNGKQPENQNFLSV